MSWRSASTRSSIVAGTGGRREGLEVSSVGFLAVSLGSSTLCITIRSCANQGLCGQDPVSVSRTHRIRIRQARVVRQAHAYVNGLTFRAIRAYRSAWRRKRLQGSQNRSPALTRRARLSRCACQPTFLRPSTPRRSGSQWHARANPSREARQCGYSFAAGSPLHRSRRSQGEGNLLINL